MLLKEAAVLLDVSVSTIWRWAQEAGIAMNLHDRRCSHTVDMFSGQDGNEEGIRHDGEVIGKLYQEKHRRQHKQV